MFTFRRPDRPHMWPRRSAGRRCLTVALLFFAVCTQLLPVTGLARAPESDVPPGQPTLLAPALRAAGVSTAPRFLWSDVPSATSFVLQVSIWPDFSTMVIDEDGITDTAFTPSFLFADGTMYFWRVRGINDAGSGPWAPSLSGWIFTTETENLPPPVPVLPPLEAVDVPLVATFSWDGVPEATSYDLEISSSIAFNDIVYQQHGIEGTSHTLPAPLPPGALLFWRIRSASGGNTSLWSPVVSGWPFMTAVSALARPVQTSPGPGSAGVSVSPVLSWEPVPGATGYIVQISTREMIAGGELAFTGITETSLSLPSPLANLTTYFWRVCAVNGSETGMWSAPITGRIFTTTSAGITVPEPVAPPDGALAVALPVRLVWHGVEGATAYDVHVYAEPFIGGTDRVISDVMDTAVVLDQGILVGGMQYHWAVRARTAAGNSAWGPPGSGWSFTTAYAPPAIPVLNAPSDGAHEVPRHAVLSWWNNSDSVATRFDLQVDTAGTFEDPVIDREGITGTEVTVVLPPHATCSWRVRAANPAGKSGWSEVWRFGTSDVAMEAPMLISPLSGAVDVPLQPTFTWRPVVGATTYQLQVSGAGTFTYDFLLTVNEQGIAGTTFRPLVPLKKATSYAWRVRGMNATDTTLWSPMFTARTFTTVPPAPPAPALRAPAWGDTLVSVTPGLSWFSAPGATSYGVQVATDEDFANIVFAQCGIEGTAVTVADPLSGTSRYYWRVTARNGGGVSPFSPAWTFVTVASTPTPPMIVRQPADQHIVAGQPATFIAGVTGTRPMAYQWMKNGAVIPGGNGPCYTTAMLDIPDDGAVFTCTATNAHGVATTREARVLVVAAPVSVIRNGDFDLGSAPWAFHSDAAGSFGADAPGINGTMAGHVVIDGEGVNVQLYQADLALEPYTTYELSFRVRSKFGNDLAVTLGQHTCPYTNYGLDEEYVSVGREWRECSLIFRTTGSTIPVEDARLSLTFGPFDRAGEEYFIDDVALVKHIASDDVQSLLTNAGFERGTKPWAFYSDGTGSLDVDSPGQDSRHAARVRIVAPGANVQLFQSGITLEPNALYRLTFDGYSTTGHDVIVALHRHQGNGESFGLAERTIDLGTGWATHTLLFVARERELPLVDGRLRFWLAPFAVAGDEYFFDDVILERVAAAGSAEISSSLVVDPGFEEGGSAWWTYSNGRSSFGVDAQGPGSAHAGHVIVTAGGSNMQLSQSIPALAAGAVHQLSFNARSNTGRDLEVGIHQDNAPYHDLGMGMTCCDLTPAWQPFTFVFRTPDEMDPANPTRVHFSFGPFARSGDEYFIDDVMLQNMEGGDAKQVGMARGAGSNAAPVPTELTLRQNYPNPFNPSTTISFGLAEESRVRIVVYDVLGREVVTLLDGTQPAGFAAVVWDATNAGSRSVGSGIYFYRLTAVGVSGRSETLVGSMLLMR